MKHLAGPLSAPVMIINVPGDFSTIQAAVDAAGPHSQIFVAPGTYTESVTILKSNLTLQAMIPADGQRAVLDGASFPTGIDGIHVGSSTTPVSRVNIIGFVVQNFENGIVLENATNCRVELNECHENLNKLLPFNASRGNGIKLFGSSNNAILDNIASDNGHDGIQLRSGSSTNTVRANTTQRNGNVQLALPGGRNGCGIDITAGVNTGNVVEANELSDGQFSILLVGAGVTGNLITDNRTHGHLRAGISLLAGAGGNTIRDNNATGNGLGNIAPTLTFDLFDAPPTNNTWINNQGTVNF